MDASHSLSMQSGKFRVVEKREHLTCLQQLALAVGQAVLLYEAVSPPHVLHPSGDVATAVLSAAAITQGPTMVAFTPIDLTAPSIWKVGNCKLYQ